MKFGKIFLHTWLFWSLLACINIHILGGIIFLPFLPFRYLLYNELDGLNYLWHFRQFLRLPFLVGGIFAVASIAFCLKKNIKWKRATYIVNAVFLITFLVVASFWKYHLIKSRAEVIGYDCYYQSSFISSLRYAGDEFEFNVHALLEKNDSVYIWSYRELDFFRINKNLSQNLGSCKHVR